MKRLSVCRRVRDDIKSVKKEYKSDAEIRGFAISLKKDVGKSLDLYDGLYEAFCVKVKSRDFNEKDILEILSRGTVDFKKAFMTETLVKCALLRGIAVGNENALRNFRKLKSIDFSVVFKLCGEEKALEKYGDFNISDDETKMLYRKKMFLKGDTGEFFEPPKRGEITLIAEILLPIIICITLSFYTDFSFLLFFPVWQICSALIVGAAMRIFKTEKLPRVKSDFLTAENSKTVIAVSVLLTDGDSLKNMEEHIKKLYFSNCNDNISLCISADLKPSKSRENEDDENILSQTEKFVKRINESCRDVFCVVRRREYSKTQGEYIGRERKRGAFEDLIKLLEGEKTGDFHIFGDVPENVKYMLALDSDTELTLDCAEELLRTALHPANRGYGVFTVRTETDNVWGQKTAFARIMSGDGGAIPYHSAFAERYQDIFGKGIFAGKGLVNISKYRESCSGKFKSETVLSHDIIEGEILSAAYVSDCQALDAFPSNELSYLKRLHRWVRGDWQNSVFLFERSFSCLSKFKIFDNLRRSVTPVFALLCITASSLSPRKESLLLFITALLSLTINEVISFLRRGEAAPLIRAFVSLTMLPAEALVCLDGAVKGLYRRLVSGKNMLLWTTASESERSRACRTLFLLPNIIFGLLIFSPRFYIKALALIFILNIPFFILSGKKEKIKKPKIDEKTKKMLLSDAEKMWLYYKNFANAENNFLPPDNVGAHITKRTSPTDIGMMLLACLASFDLNIINRDEMLSFLNDAITSAERLSTVHGNLYNWYDTRTLQPLPPFFVSSVDSGNFVCSLTSLRNGLLHVGGAEELVKRIDKIIGATDLKLFFSEKNDLMSIGVDACGGKKNENSYGVFMSEARLTLYYAVSSRLIPQKFFYGADRRLNSFGGRFGPASWNGTLFEYFMPNIFLPAYENTFEREGLSFCLYCQKKYARKNKIPFGISESCYFDFDENMNYLYKAHGVKRLALNRGIENSFVVSPYSSYLILPFDSDFALGNLNRLRNIGAYGEYGFFEAYDFSENEAVKCFMAHHIGMSILSIDNYLNDYIMQKRFLDGKMLSGELLLHERKRKL